MNKTIWIVQGSFHEDADCNYIACFESENGALRQAAIEIKAFLEDSKDDPFVNTKRCLEIKTELSKENIYEAIRLFNHYEFQQSWYIDLKEEELHS